MNELAGKIAIITGGGSGIGNSMAKTFAEEGAKVVVADISSERAENVVKSIKAKGGVALAIAADASKPNDVDQMIKTTLEKFGRIDILVNNAGIGPKGANKILRTPSDLIVENLPEELWDKVMAINLKSVFLCSQAVIPTMKKQKSGNIINMASATAFFGGRTYRGSGAHYHVSKAGIVNFTKTLAVQLGPYGIRANTIAPGPIYGADPDGTQSISYGTSAEYMAEVVKTIPLGRAGTPKDVANVALFLASDKSSFVHGATLHVNGGFLMV